MSGMDRVVAAYMAIKDARTARRHAWEKADLALEEEQDKIKLFMLNILNQAGATSIATEYGTAYRSEKVKVGAADWSAIWEWAKENDAMDLFERRLKSKFVQDFMEENDNRPPPGVNVHRQFEVAVRRKAGSSNSNDEDDST